jgi:hypothetical protein
MKSIVMTWDPAESVEGAVPRQVKMIIGAEEGWEPQLRPGIVSYSSERYSPHGIVVMSNRCTAREKQRTR